jgi:steroid delta-isomerase-like uncharacterized protein
MAQADHKALIHRLIGEGWNKGELGVVDEVLAKDFVYHDLVMPDIFGPEGYKKYLQEVRTSYPDFHMTIVEMIQEGDTLAGRLHWEGTQLGASPGLKVPGTGKRVNVAVGFTGHLAGGKMVEMWLFQDWVGIMRQLELLPKPK